MPHCKNCDSHVSAAFRRVAGDNAGRVSQCPRCTARNGAAEHADAPDYYD